MPPRTCGKGSRSPCGPATVASWSTACECCGCLCAATGRYAEAVTVWAAPPSTPARRSSRPDARGGAQPGSSRCARPGRRSGPARARAAEERGAAMSLDTAAEYALMLTAPGPPPAAGAAGWARLSARERELVTLVAQGRTNAQIAAAAVHQRPHRPLAPGPDPGQDRLPPPRRPDPPGPERGPGLAATRLPGPGTGPCAPVGHPTPAAAKGSAGRCRALPGRASLPVRAARAGRIRTDRSTIMITQLLTAGIPSAHGTAAAGAACAG